MLEFIGPSNAQDHVALSQRAQRGSLRLPGGVKGWGEVPVGTGGQGDVGSAVSERPRKCSDGTSFTGKRCSKSRASAGQGLASGTGSRSKVASSEAPVKPASRCAGAAAGVWKHNADLFGCLLFSEAVGSPPWNGVALQDTKPGAGWQSSWNWYREI